MQTVPWVLSNQHTEGSGDHKEQEYNLEVHFYRLVIIGFGLMNALVQSFVGVMSTS